MNDGEIHVVLIQPDRVDGGWVGEVLTKPGCMSQGDNPHEALAMLAEALEAVEDIERQDGREEQP